jgi:DNA repair protein RadC
MGEHEGHRQRIMQKLDSGVLLDHELLEIVLFNAIPRRNTNDLAHRLLAEFGTLGEVFSAPFKRLQNVKGIGISVAAYIRVIGIIMRKIYDVIGTLYYPERFDRDGFFSYVKEEYKPLKREVIDIYLLDGEGKIITRCRFGETSFFNAEMHPQDLTRILVEYTPVGIVMVHNHPYGEAKASEMDDYTTRQVQLICSTQNVLLCDHLVYAQNGVYSYYLSNKLQEIAAEFSMNAILSDAKKGGANA